MHKSSYDNDCIKTNLRKSNYNSSLKNCKKELQMESYKLGATKKKKC